MDEHVLCFSNIACFDSIIEAVVKMKCLLASAVILLAFAEAVFGICEDKEPWCNSWKSSGYCKKTSVYHSYMKTNCAMSCGFCFLPPPPLPTADPYPNCVDKMSYCSTYKPYCNDKDYITYLQDNCKRTCNYCHITTQPPPTTKPWTTQMYTVPGGAAALQPGCGKKGPGHTRIVGGKAAKPGDWPWIVNFDYKYNTANPGHHCGGTLLTDEWVLSAAHCFHDDTAKGHYWLKLGEHDLKTSSGYEQRIQVADIIFHPRYDPNTYDNDLALVKLSTKARINSRVKTACLPDQNTTFATGTKCYISGWGLLREYGRGPQILQQAQVPLADQLMCKFSNPNHKVTDNMICAGYAKGGIDACQGDSGGPLVCKRDDDTWFLWGVVSWGVGCGRAHTYGFYAKTKVLRRWVDSVVFTKN